MTSKLMTSAAIAIAALGMAVIAPVANAQTSHGIAAVVNDDIITSHDLRQRVLFMIATTGVERTEESLTRVQAQALRNLVDEKIQIQESEKYELIGFFDPVKENALKVAAEFGYKLFNSIDDLIDAVEVVDIVTPTLSHFDCAKKAIEKGRHIFVEKPIAHDIEKALKIKEISEDQDIFVQTGFIERFNPAVIELKSIVAKDRVINLDLTRTNKLSSRITDVDVILDLMIHDIDIALYLNGPVSKVKAYGARENGLVAFASAFIIHENGSFSRVLASRMTDKKIRSIQATCENSFVNSDLLRKEIVVSMQSEINQKSGEAYVISSVEHQVELRPQEALLVELQSFIGSCLGEDIIVPDADAGVNALRICDEIQKEIL